MSRVYLASDLKLPGKVWAVKESFAAPGHKVPVAQEAELLISLNHPRLPRIVDFIQEDGSGYSYIVMDYIVGEHLDRYVKARGGRVPTEALIRFALQIAEGLHYLHTHRPPVIHRDVKPSNLLVDGKGQIRFIDFGIARTYEAGKAEDTIQLGTVGFAAPEQYGGRQSDGRADLYSLGAVLLYLGTDCKYSAWTQEAEDCLRRQGHGQLLPVLERLLQQRPEARFASAEAAGEALREVLRAHAAEASEVSDASPSAWEGPPTGGQPAAGGRTAVIAVIGASPGAGTTHTAIALAHVLSRSAKRIAIAEMEAKSPAFQRLARIALGEFASSAPRQFRIGNVQYVRAPSRTEWIELLTGGYEYLICDLGTGRQKEQMEEFKRADLSLVVGSAAEWRAEELERFAETVGLSGKWPSTWKFCVPLASASAVKRLAKRLRTRSVYAIPAEPEPFEPGEDITAALRVLCGSLLPRPKRSGRSFLAKQKL
ncbi:serine/threonine protein kinase [Paenibacillus oralis]|uniref:non-specific serine/threonine protein kinase n=2 Tax=Paenibacillus oralis TaxID=2490856 RepID=A0A3P3UBM8_9BACL|nr:serine/threonine protein kinase [Paenibacillus oralis]